jgi:hypothetical protein
MKCSTDKPGIKLVIDWIKGVRMDIPYSRWVMFSIGVYVLAAALDKLSSVAAMVISLVR